jgi:hypothetical protein
MPLAVRAMMRPTIGKLNRLGHRPGGNVVVRTDWPTTTLFAPVADMVGKTYECHSMALDFPG